MITACRFFLCLAAALLAGILPARSTAIPTNTAADLVLGQALFTTNGSPTPATATSLRTPSGVAVDPVSSKVFVADRDNNRVLRYASQTALTNGASPEVVIGQSTFSASTANQGGGVTPGQNTLSSPNDVFVDIAGRLWIADTGNSRVLLFENAANLSTNAPADRVFGQTSFTAYLANHTQNTLGNPRGVCVDPAGTLWVADTGSHRIMGWKLAATLPNGALADRVLGQPDFTDNTARTTQRGLFNPWGVAADATHLWVADSDNNRVLLYANYPSINYAPASIVLGQTNYTAAIAATSAAGLTRPTSVAISGVDLWICDDGNNRVLYYPSVDGLAPGSPATAVIGQASLLTGSAGLSSQKLSLLDSHIAVDVDGNLFVADRLNNRALRFPVSVTPVTPVTPVVTTPTITLTGKTKIHTSKTTYTLKGTSSATGGITRVSYSLDGGKSYARAKGTTNWKAAQIPLKQGTNKVLLYSVGSTGLLSRALKVTINRD